MADGIPPRNSSYPLSFFAIANEARLLVQRKVVDAELFPFDERPCQCHLISPHVRDTPCQPLRVKIHAVNALLRSHGANCVPVF